MAIQPFATQIQPPQIAAPQPINQLAQFMQLRGAQQENELRQMQMAQLQTSTAQENALRSYLGGDVDLSTPEAQRNLLKFGKPGAEVQKTLRESEAARLNQQKIGGEITAQQHKLITDRLEQVQTQLKRTGINPRARLAIHEAVHADGVLGPYLASMGVTAEQGRAEIISAAQNPASWEQFILASDFGLDKLLSENRAKAGERRAESGERRAQAVEGRAQAKESREAKAAELGVFSAETGGFTSNLTGKFTPLTAVQQHKDASAARKALKQIGYDPETASDTVTELIKNSTGSLAGTWVDSLARSVGVGTAGARNIESLAAISTQMVLDLNNGKLGAGFSNEDRDFLKSTLGDVANPRKTRSERLDAWNVAKSRMVKLAGETEPTAPKSGAAETGARTGAPAVKSGVTKSGVTFSLDSED